MCIRDSPVTAHGSHLGYLVMDVDSPDSSLIAKITSCVAGAIVNYGRLEEQKLQTEQLKPINAELARKTNYDSITGLPNRRQYLAILEQTVQEHDHINGTFSILHIVLNDLKHVAIHHGAGNSDFLIRSISARMEDALPSGATLFRTGSAEFSIILAPNTGDRRSRTKESSDSRFESDQSCNTDSILDVLQQSYELSGEKTNLSYDVGLSHFPVHGDNADELIRNANIALHVAEQRNGNGYAIYDPSLNHSGINKWQLEQQMRKGLENDEFCLFYQPRVDTVSGEILSFEALIRWIRPENEDGQATQQVGPYVFIPIAEETGFITRIGDFVLRQACKQLVEWNSLGLRCRISINLSAKELEDDTLIKRLINTVEEYQLTCEQLELEVTESTAMLDICLLYTSPSPRDATLSRMPSSA